MDSAARHGSCQKAHVHIKATTAVRFILATLARSRYSAGRVFDVFRSEKEGNVRTPVWLKKDRQGTQAARLARYRVVVQFKISLGPKRQIFFLLQRKSVGDELPYCIGDRDLFRCDVRRL